MAEHPEHSEHPVRPPTASQPLLGEFEALASVDLIARYARGVEQIDRGVLSLTDAQLDMAFLPSANVGRWPVRVLLGHLADAEVSLVHRMRRIYAEEHPIMNPWDETAFVDRGIYGTTDPGANATGVTLPPQPIGAFIATIHTMRRWTSEWLACLRESDFSRRGLHTERGEISLRFVADYATWHLEHHNWFLQRKLGKFGAGSRG